MSNYGNPTPDALQSFKAAIAKTESGGEAEPYKATGPSQHRTLGWARGKYQIMDANWENWRGPAGWGGAHWSNPEAQEAVADEMFSQYFRKYGRWDLVAIAWFGGEGAANKARDNGIGSVANRSDGYNTIPEYVSKTIGHLESGTTSADVQRHIASTGGPPGTPEGQSPADGQQVRVNSPKRNMAQAVFGQLHNFVKANPGAEGNQEMMQRAMGSFFGMDPMAGTASVQTRARGETPPPEAQTSAQLPEMPTEAPGLGQSGVR